EKLDSTQFFLNPMVRCPFCASRGLLGSQPHFATDKPFGTHTKRYWCLVDDKKYDNHIPLCWGVQNLYHN
ncbi:hypothetical protein, partial [Arcobacter sp.]|uniref:hypothetical protein n=1 Tax=Arcobacter sp. TaxID=1872629 RepID=UPI003D0C5CAD